MKNYYIILETDEDSPDYIPIRELINVEFGSGDDYDYATELVEDKTESRIYMNEQTVDYFFKHIAPYHYHSMAITRDLDRPLHPIAEAKLDNHPIEIDNSLPSHWLVTESQIEYAHGFAKAINDCRGEETMTKVNVIDNNNAIYTSPEDFEARDWFYNTADRYHYYLMPLVDSFEHQVALINIEHNQCITIDESAEAAIKGSFLRDEANRLIKIPADQVEVTYRFK